MTMHRTIGAIAAATIALATVPGLTATASARAVKPGAIQTLALDDAGSAFHLKADWSASTHTTRYAVKVSDVSKSLTLANVSVTAPTTAYALAFSTAKAKVGDLVRVAVTPYNGKTKGTAKVKSITLADHTAPTGSISAAKVTPDDDLVWQVSGTISDDVSSGAGITGLVDWGDGSPTESWSGSGEHTYPSVAARYVPTVTLTDEAGNPSQPILPPRAVVVGDTNAPTASYANRTTAWASYTRVTLTESGFTEQWSPSANVRRLVDWGDGSALTAVLGTGALSHVYRTTGQHSFTPMVRLTDEAGNTSDARPGTPVMVTQDLVAPRVSLTLPATARRAVSSWRVLRGNARDAGVGIRAVRVRAVQKRGSYWYAYRWGTHTWVRTGTRMSVAFQKAGIRYAVPSTTRQWSARLYNLRTGTLVYRVRGVDRVGNLSKVIQHSQLLTRY